jgi:membrane protein DedA with SNARE-associated domain
VSGLVHHYGLVALFLAVMLESGGVPFPGETALIAAAIFASQGDLDIVQVIAVAAAAAIVGDNIGYWIGRKAARPLLYRYPRVRRHADRVLPPAERFFKRHGGKAVFLARFFGGLRVTGAWMAGITQMSWWRFLVWNAAGGIVWALGVGLLAYYAGKAAADALARYGVYAAIGGALAVVVLIVVVHVWRRRIVEENV